MALFGKSSKGKPGRKPAKSTVSRSGAAKAVAHRASQIIPSCEESSFIADWANKMEHQTFVM